MRRFRVRASSEANKTEPAVLSGPTIPARPAADTVVVVTQALSVSGAEQAAARVGIEIRLLEDVGDLAEADGLLARIWSAEGGLMGVNVMKALAHSGHYVAGAWRGGELVGASVAWAWGPDRPGALHSHITGIAPHLQSQGVGLALKLHQAAWAKARGIDCITWTFDPMVRRNAWFNLVKLGARAESYHRDFYGEMHDGVNDGELTDRCLVVWTSLPDRNPGPEPSAPPPATVLLAASAGQVPEMSIPADKGPERWPDRLLCQVPADAVALRREDPQLARQWRLALRATMGEAMGAGYAATSMTPDGYYVLERREEPA